MDIDQLEAIIKLLKQNEVTQFELEKDGTRLKLVRELGTGPATLVSVPAHSVEPAIVTSAGNGVLPSSHVPPPHEAAPSNWVRIESPIVGTFYRKPSPDAEPYVNQGDIVKKGDTLCIIEAMKLMNEIEASSSGRIEKVLLSDGEVVEYGEALFLINPDV